MTPATVTIQRRVQWMDTDAAGIWHHSVVLRWAEEAEAELHRSLGIIDLTFGATPRVKTEFEFPDSVRFDDVMDITLTVSHVGTTSMTYQIEVTTGSRSVANGQMMVVFIDRASGEKKPWPDTVRQALTG
jgi:acyl-CoA thioester hydrolase